MSRSNFYINNHGFQHVDGELPMPVRSSNIFQSPATPHIGAQLLRPASRVGQLTLKRYDTASRLFLNRDLYLAAINNTVQVVRDGLHMAESPYEIKYFVSNVEILDARLIVRASGYFDGFAYDFSPASQVTSRWTLYAIPAWS